MVAEKVMKKYILLLSLSACLSLWSFVQAETINRIVATVDDDPITLQEVRAFGKVPGQRPLFMPPEGAANMTERDVLEVLIMNRLINKEVEAQGLKAKDEEVNEYIERIKMESHLDDDRFKAALAQQGMTLESYREQVADEIERAMLVSREIGAHVNVTPQDVERYYKEHNDEYAQAEQVHVRHIFLPLAGHTEEETLAQMEDIRKHAVAGEDFGKLADQYSQGPGAGQGGDLGNFKKGQMAKEIEDVAFALKPGEISQPFRMGAGIHLIKVEEHTVPGQQTIDKDTAEQIKRKLYNEALKQRYDRWFQEDLRFRHNIENFMTASTNRASRAALRKTSEASTEKESSSEKSTEPENQPKKGFFKGIADDLWPF